MTELLAAAAVARPQISDRCAHCGERLPSGAPTAFCCAGCATAHDVIAGLGLARFYDRFRLDPNVRRLRPNSDIAVDYMAHCRVGANGELALGGGRLDVGAVGGLNNQGLVRGGGRIGAAVTNAAAGEIRRLKTEDEGF